MAVFLRMERNNRPQTGPLYLGQVETVVSYYLLMF